MDDESRQMLYPFLYPRPAGAAAGDVERTLADVEHSIREKCRDVIALRRQILQEYLADLLAAAEAMAAAFERGATLLAFGNGGSATDAHDVAADCLVPPDPRWRRLPALALTNDVAVVTAIGNDVGFDKVFARQIIGLGRAGDIALGISTSGQSANVLNGLAEARRRGLLTIAFSGADGGEMARARAADFIFVARLEHIPRIQEGHATIWHALIELVQSRLGAAAACAVVPAVAERIS